MTTPCIQEKRIEKMETELNKTATLLARIDERQQNHDKVLKQILEQTQKTNGRVNKLEVWKNRILGGVTVVSILFGFISYASQVAFNATIESAVTAGINKFVNSSEFEKIVTGIINEQEITLYD